MGVDVGVRFMRNRKPVNVKAFTVAHNLFMFWASLYMVVETVRQVQLDTSSPSKAATEGRCACMDCDGSQKIIMNRW